MVCPRGNGLNAAADRHARVAADDILRRSREPSVLSSG